MNFLNVYKLNCARYIFSEDLTVLKALNSFFVESKLVQECLEVLNHLAKTTSLPCCG